MLVRRLLVLLFLFLSLAWRASACAGTDGSDTASCRFTHCPATCCQPTRGHIPRHAARFDDDDAIPRLRPPRQLIPLRYPLSRRPTLQRRPLSRRLPRRPSRARRSCRRTCRCGACSRRRTGWCRGDDRSGRGLGADLDRLCRQEPGAGDGGAAATAPSGGGRQFGAADKAPSS